MTMQQVYQRLCNLGLLEEYWRRCMRHNATTQEAHQTIAREMLGMTMDGIGGG